MPSTTNLSISYPAATALVSQGYQQIADVATGIDAYFGSWTSYTPTGTNISSGAYTAAYKKVGKIGFVRINITGGTATAAGSVSVSLPSGWTPAANGGATAYSTTLGTLTAAIGTGGLVTIYNGTGVANFALGASVACRMQFVIELN